MSLIFHERSRQKFNVKYSVYTTVVSGVVRSSLIEPSEFRLSHAYTFSEVGERAKNNHHVTFANISAVL